MNVEVLKKTYKTIAKRKYIKKRKKIYKEIVKRWKKADSKLDTYSIAKRSGSNMKIKDRVGKEGVFCWRKK